MSKLRIPRLVFGLGLLAILVAAASWADPVERRTFFTFNRPISLPGVTLAPGQYLFKVVDTTTNRKVVHVMSADGKKAYAQLFSIPVVRLEASLKPEVRFMETGANMPSAVKTWWYINDRIGYEFIYPKEQARLLARGSAEPILTTVPETAKAEETATAPLARLEPGGKEAEVAAAAAPAAPTGVSQAGTVAPEPVATVAEAAPPAAGIPGQETGGRTSLPATGTTLPRTGLIGLLALVAAGGLRLWRTSRG